MIGSLLMARFSYKLSEGELDRRDRRGHGHRRDRVRVHDIGAAGHRDRHHLGIANAPIGVARATLMQRNTPRELRGRVFSSFFVMRDVVFLLGMGAAGLADVDPDPAAWSSSPRCCSS